MTVLATATGRVERAVAKPIGAVLGGIAQLWDMVVFSGRILVRLPRATKYRKEIATLISDMTIGAGAVVVGGGMIIVIFFLAFFTGTEVGLQGFTALEQIGAEAFSGVISSVGNTREITPLIAGVGLAAQVGVGV